MSSGDSARLPMSDSHRNEVGRTDVVAGAGHGYLQSLSSEEVVKKICFSSGCDVGSHPISGDATMPDQEYLDQLIRDKGDLRSVHAAPFRHLTRLIDRGKHFTGACLEQSELPLTPLHTKQGLLTAISRTALAA